MKKIIDMSGLGEAVIASPFLKSALIDDGQKQFDHFYNLLSNVDVNTHSVYMEQNRFILVWGDRRLELSVEKTIDDSKYHRSEVSNEVVDNLPKDVLKFFKDSRLAKLDGKVLTTHGPEAFMDGDTLVIRRWRSKPSRCYVTVKYYEVRDHDVDSLQMLPYVRNT